MATALMGFTKDRRGTIGTTCTFVRVLLSTAMAHDLAPTGGLAVYTLLESAEVMPFSVGKMWETSRESLQGGEISKPGQMLGNPRA